MLDPTLVEDAVPNATPLDLLYEYDCVCALLETEPTQPSLLYRTGHEHGQVIVFPLNYATTVVGRGDAGPGQPKEGLISFPEAETMSRQHFKISNVGDQFVLTDLKSKNGTHVNGKSLGEKHLVPMDRIRAGEVVLFFTPGSLIEDVDQ